MSRCECLRVNRIDFRHDSLSLLSMSATTAVRLPPPPPPAAASAAARPPPPLRAGPRLEYPWSLCVRAALPSRTPPKALRFCAVRSAKSADCPFVPLRIGRGASLLRLSG